MNRARPATLSGRSSRAALVPATRRCSGVLTGTPASAATSRSTASASAAYDVVSGACGLAIRPAWTVTCVAATCQRRAASHTNNARTLAATRQTAAPDSAMDILPDVRPSSGPFAVLAGSIHLRQVHVELVRGQ